MPNRDETRRKVKWQRSMTLCKRNSYTQNSLDLGSLFCHRLIFQCRMQFSYISIAGNKHTHKRTHSIRRASFNWTVISFIRDANSHKRYGKNERQWQNCKNAKWRQKRGKEKSTEPKSIAKLCKLNRTKPQMRNKWCAIHSVCWCINAARASVDPDHFIIALLNSSQMRVLLFVWWNGMEKAWCRYFNTVHAITNH